MNKESQPKKVNNWDGFSYIYVTDKVIETQIAS